MPVPGPGPSHRTCGNRMPIAKFHSGRHWRHPVAWLSIGRRESRIAASAEEEGQRPLLASRRPHRRNVCTPTLWLNRAEVTSAPATKAGREPASLLGNQEAVLLHAPAQLDVPIRSGDKFKIAVQVHSMGPLRGLTSRGSGDQHKDQAIHGVVLLHLLSLGSLRRLSRERASPVRRGPAWRAGSRRSSRGGSMRRRLRATCCWVGPWCSAENTIAARPPVGPPSPHARSART